MVWEPYALAVIFGLVVSVAIYFVLLWPATADELEEQEEAEEAAEQRATEREPEDAVS